MYLYSLLLTIAAEGLVACVWNYFDRHDCQYRLIIATVMGLNLITHPLAWSMFDYLPGSFWLIEAAVILAETIGLVLILKTSPSRALILSFLMNSVTIFIGFLLA